MGQYIREKTGSFPAYSCSLLCKKFKNNWVNAILSQVPIQSIGT